MTAIPRGRYQWRLIYTGHVTQQDVDIPLSITLRRVRTRAVKVPIRRPPISASGAIPEAPLVLIDLETSEGVTGRSYVFAFASWALAPIVACVQSAFELVKDAPLAPLDVAATLSGRLRLMDSPGLLGIALSGIDMAAWDALARAQNLPLVRLLGAAPRQVPAYNSCGLWISPTDTLGDEALELLAEGDFGAVKLRLGRADTREDERALDAVASSIGNSAQLMVDFNQSLTTNQAIERGQMLDGRGLVWIEEPIRHENFEGYARIRERVTTPIQTGENLLDAHRLARAIAMKSLDFVMPDVQRIGGVTGWLRAASVASAHDIEVSSHLFPEFSRHLLAATDTLHWLEYMDWANPILTDPVTVENGTVKVPDTPGAGIEWNEDMVRRYQL